MTPRNSAGCVRGASRRAGSFHFQSMCLLPPVASALRFHTAKPLPSLYFCRMPKHIMAIQHRAYHAGQEVRYQQNVIMGEVRPEVQRSEVFPVDILFRNPQIIYDTSQLFYWDMQKKTEQQLSDTSTTLSRNHDRFLFLCFCSFKLQPLILCHTFGFQSPQDFVGLATPAVRQSCTMMPPKTQLVGVGVGVDGEWSPEQTHSRAVTERVPWNPRLVTSDHHPVQPL